MEPYKENIVQLSLEQCKDIRQPRFKPCSHGHHESCVAFHDMFVCGCQCHRSEEEFDIGGEGG